MESTAGFVDADELRAHMDHVDLGYRRLDEQMIPYVVKGFPAPGYGLTNKTRIRFIDKRMEWLDFMQHHYPRDLFWASDETEQKTLGFEVALGGFQAQFVLETYLMDPPDPSKPLPTKYTPFPKNLPKPEEKEGPFDKIAEAIGEHAKGQSQRLDNAIIVAGIIGAAWFIHEIRK